MEQEFKNNTSNVEPEVAPGATEQQESSVLTDETLHSNAEKNRVILERTAKIERILLLAITAAIVVTLIVMGVRLL